MYTLLHCPTIELRDKGLCDIWSGYGKWSECSKSCGSGTQVRSRRIISVKRAEGETCRHVRGRKQQTRICSGNICGRKGRFTYASSSSYVVAVFIVVEVVVCLVGTIHAFLLQDLSSDAAPRQCFPFGPVAATAKNRLRFCVPNPHVLLHLFHGPKSDHIQSTVVHFT